MLKTILKKPKNNKKQKRTVRTLGQMAKAKLYRQNHKEAYTYTLTKRTYLNLKPFAQQRTPLKKQKDNPQNGRKYLQMKQLTRD